LGTLSLIDLMRAFTGRCRLEQVQARAVGDHLDFDSSPIRSILRDVDHDIQARFIVARSWADLTASRCGFLSSAWLPVGLVTCPRQTVSDDQSR
jgi:hypothetical protein